MARSPARLADRQAMGLAAVYTPAEAADRLPWDDEFNRKWLKECGLIHRIPWPARDGHRVVEYVLWSEVHALLQGPARTAAEEDSAPRPRGRLRRGDL